MRPPRKSSGIRSRAPSTSTTSACSPILQPGISVGYLPQDVELFAGTVRENIARMEETHDDEEVINAAKLAEEAGNPLAVNMVLLGALIQTGVLPLETEQVKEAMQRKTKPAFLASNLKAYELGYNVAAKAA